MFENLRLWHWAEYLLHHGEMLPVVVGLEQGEAEVELEGDAADAPDVTRLTPAKLQDHLRSSVVSRAHHLAVVLPVEGGGPEVNQADLRVLHLPHVLPLQHQVSGLLAFILLSLVRTCKVYCLLIQLPSFQLYYAFKIQSVRM